MHDKKRKGMMTTHDISTDTLFVDGKCLHGELHTIKASRFPDEVCGEVVCALGRYTVSPPQFQPNLVGNV